MPITTATAVVTATPAVASHSCYQYEAFEWSEYTNYGPYYTYYTDYYGVYEDCYDSSTGVVYSSTRLYGTGYSYWVQND